MHVETLKTYVTDFIHNVILCFMLNWCNLFGLAVTSSELHCVRQLSTLKNRVYASEMLGQGYNTGFGDFFWLAVTYNVRLELSSIEFMQSRCNARDKIPVLVTSLD